MSLLKKVAHECDLDPRVTLAGIPDELVDAMLLRAFAGDDVAAILAAVGTPRVRDGYRMRPLNLTDVQAVVGFVERVKRHITLLDRSAKNATERADKLRQLMTVTS